MKQIVPDGIEQTAQAEKDFQTHVCEEKEGEEKAEQEKALVPPLVEAEALLKGN